MAFTTFWDVTPFSLADRANVSKQRAVSAFGVATCNTETAGPIDTLATTCGTTWSHIAEGCEIQEKRERLHCEAEGKEKEHFFVGGSLDSSVRPSGKNRAKATTVWNI
jgi:hypothetical protein